MYSLLKRIARSILSQPRNKVTVEVGEIDYHHILEGQKIVITGGSKGIGFAMAKKFVSEGASVLITGRNENTLKETVSSLDENRATCYLVHDISEESDFNKFVQLCSQKLGGVDSVVLNAGISLHEGNILNVTEDGFDLQFRTNLRGSYFISQAFLKYKLERNEGGNILFLSSETAGKSVDIPYGLTKAAINSLVGGLARRVYKRGIRVNAIAPGVTYTDMTKGNHIITDDYSNNNAAGRFLLPSEIAEVACFLLSKASMCVTGEILYCDAGNHLKINGDSENYVL